MEEKYSKKSILERYRKGRYEDYSHNIINNDWYEKPIKKTEPSLSEVIDIIEKTIEKHPRNIIKILESLPEDEIQNFLRAKKLSKIKDKSQ